MKFLIAAVDGNGRDCTEKYIDGIKKNGYDIQRVEIKTYKEEKEEVNVTYEYYIKIGSLSKLYALTKITDCNVCLNEKHIIIYDSYL